MLSVEENELLMRVGPGTPMGNLMRRYWLPAMLSSEVPEPDCAPVRLRLLGEDLVAFRLTDGKIAVLETYCPHRNANLFWGRNEEDGIRCVYHGWKFNGAGECVDMPNEPATSRFAEKVTVTAYQAEERAGVVFVYMGAQDRTPDVPDFEWMHMPEAQRYASKRLQFCNYLQNLEGECDSSHIAFLHRNNLDAGTAASVTQGAPVFEVADTDFGLAISARRDAPNDEYYWRITPFMMPFYTIIPGLGTLTAAVPSDDETMIGITVSWNPERAFTEQDMRYLQTGPHAEVDERFMPVRNKANDYLIDRQAQKTRSFTGIEGVRVQDMAVQEDQRGPLANRARERLGTSDQGIIALRRRLVEQAKAIENGLEPQEPLHGDWYHVRAVALNAPRAVPWETLASDNMMPVRIRAEAQGVAGS
ncbi:MAG TPA: Rieske 2Fe-2S domain-containing protein [Dehalococcoidia bacterium]|nr:Rieske 2Fe-2S domain-containing protein [Dehalococcoidia bacterium]